MYRTPSHLSIGFTRQIHDSLAREEKRGALEVNIFPAVQGLSIQPHIYNLLQICEQYVNSLHADMRKPQVRIQTAQRARRPPRTIRRKRPAEVQLSECAMVSVVQG